MKKAKPKTWLIPVESGGAATGFQLINGQQTQIRNPISIRRAYYHGLKAEYQRMCGNITLDAGRVFGGLTLIRAPGTGRVMWRDQKGVLILGHPLLPRTLNVRRKGGNGK